MDFVNRINELGLFQQLAMILAGVTAVFVLLLRKLVFERKAIAHALIMSEVQLHEMARHRVVDRPMPSTVEELIANDPDLVLTKEYEKYRLLVGLTPPWLAQNKSVLDDPWTLTSRAAR